MEVAAVCRPGRATSWRSLPCVPLCVQRPPSRADAAAGPLRKIPVRLSPAAANWLSCFDCLSLLPRCESTEVWRSSIHLGWNLTRFGAAVNLMRFGCCSVQVVIFESELVEPFLWVTVDVSYIFCSVIFSRCFGLWFLPNSFPILGCC